MFELLLTSFPVIIQYFRLKRRGEAMSVWNMKTPVFLWAGMAFALFFVVFYYHPKSFSGVVPFRTISVVAQTSGPVTEIAVSNGERVSAGDLLFRIEDSTQLAALEQAQAEYDKIAAAERKADDSLTLAEASVAEAEASLARLRDDLKNAETLLSKGATPENKVRDARTAVTVAEAQLTAARAQFDVAFTDLSETIPAQRKAAEAAAKSAEVALGKTEVRAFSDGVVTQLAMSVGGPASQLILSPAMVIIPDRPADARRRIVAGFSQVAREELYVGMPAEIACESNLNIGFENAILPAQVVTIQPAIASGQVVPGGVLRDPARNPARGSVLVYFELLHDAHEAAMMDGSGCIVQTYNTGIEGIFGHIVAATGVVKAGGLRLLAWGTILTGIGLAGGH